MGQQDLIDVLENNKNHKYTTKELGLVLRKKHNNISFLLKKIRMSRTHPQIKVEFVRDPSIRVRRFIQIWWEE